jgi:MerR family transcriptional regulator, repressor of the yfmOP operon
VSVTGASARRLRIGEVAQLTGTTPRTIRYYEELGLLPAALGREPGAHRVYESEDVERLREVLRLKELLGVSLEELRELAAAELARASLRREWDEGIEDPLRHREALTKALGYVKRQLELAQRRRVEVTKLEGELRARHDRLHDRLRELDRAYLELG